MSYPAQFYVEAKTAEKKLRYSSFIVVPAVSLLPQNDAGIKNNTYFIIGHFSIC